LCVKISAVAKLKQMFFPLVVWHGLWFSTIKQRNDDAMLSFWGRFFRSFNGFEAKSIIGIHLIPYIKSAYYIYKYCSWSDKTAMSSKRILNVDLSYFPNCTDFFTDIGK